MTLNKSAKYSSNIQNKINFFFSVMPVGVYSQPRAQLLLSHICIFVLTSLSIVDCFAIFNSLFIQHCKHKVGNAQQTYPDTIDVISKQRPISVQRVNNGTFQIEINARGFWSGFFFLTFQPLHNMNGFSSNYWHLSSKIVILLQYSQQFSSHPLN